MLGYCNLIILSVCDDKETIEIRNLLKITKIYRGLLKFMAKVAVLLKVALSDNNRALLFMMTA